MEKRKAPPVNKRSFTKLQTDFMEWMTRMGYAEITLVSYGKRMTYFFNWLKCNEISELGQVQQMDLEAFRIHLEHRKNQHLTGGLSVKYISSFFTVLSLFNQYLQHLGYAPILKKMMSATQGIRPVINPLTWQEIRQLYAVTQENVIGYRDRAILSLYYGCGLRLQEGMKLNTSDIQFSKGLLYVGAGKNGLSRYIPMSGQVQEDLQYYLQGGRFYQDKGQSDRFLLSDHGDPLSRQSIDVRLKFLAEVAGINKRLYTHLLRHSIATHLLQSGMGLESIGQFLGHKSLESTQVYTHLVEEQRMMAL